MTEPITTRILIERLHARLGLEWIGGLEGQNREIKPFTREETGVALIGHLNLIHPNKVQVLGSTELEYLQNLDTNSYQDTVNKLFSDTLSILIVASNQKLPDEFILLADKKQIPLLRTSMVSHNLITHMRYFLGSMLAEKTTLHGVFMEVMGNGVLLTGESGIGKSELALELISRGHRLVADDAPEFSRIAPDIINGTCPEILSELLEVRGLGILNIRSLFGDSAIKPGKYLRLIINLVHMNAENMKKIDRLHSWRNTRNLMDVEIPEITFPVAPGRNLAVVVETAVRNHMLYQRGHDAAHDFIERQHRLLEQDVK